MKKIVELLIDFDNQEFDELGVDIMSLVDQPAIQTTWLAFNEDEDHSSCNHFAEEYILSEEEEQSILECAMTSGEDIDWQNTVYIDITKSEFSTLTDFLKGVSALDILNTRDVKKDEPGITKYRYAGPPAQRAFCRAMMRLNKLYTYDEIVAMSQFGGMPDANGRRPANLVWNWHGGKNCKHYWETVLVFKGDNGQNILISKGPTDGDPGKTWSQQGFWKFADEDQQIITGPAMIPNMLIPRRDTMGNIFHVYFSEESIKKIAQKFLINAAHNTDINHNDEVTTENTLLESWIIEDPKFDKSTALGFDLPKSTWMVSYKINNKETWQRIKNGELRGFSVTGTFLEKLQKK